jgi:maltose alpha-D-glucosyltransferase / alpha-amylase
VFREMHPEMEMLQFLSERASFKFAPRLAGSLIWQTTEGGTWVFGVLQDRAEHQGDAWQMTTDAVGRYFERVFQAGAAMKAPRVVNKDLLRFEEAPERVRELIGSVFYQRVTLLAQRTAQLHQALQVDDPDPEFAAEKFSPHYQRSLNSTLRKLVKERFTLLRQALPHLPDATQVLARQVLALEAAILEQMGQILQDDLQAYRTRIHGDLQLEQVLFTGKDFLIIDFEGESGASMAERKSKRSPLKDVAGMMRSFHYAAYGKIMLNDNYRDKDREVLEMWAEQWQHYVSRFFLSAYQEAMEKEGPLSADEALLLKICLLEKAIQELGYELTNQRKWVAIPLRGILEVME